MKLKKINDHSIKIIGKLFLLFIISTTIVVNSSEDGDTKKIVESDEGNPVTEENKIDLNEIIKESEKNDENQLENQLETQRETKNEVNNKSNNDSNNEFNSEFNNELNSNDNNISEKDNEKAITNSEKKVEDEFLESTINQPKSETTIKTKLESSVDEGLETKLENKTNEKTSSQTQSEKEKDNDEANDGLVEVWPNTTLVEVVSRKEYLNYKERRTTHGFMFNTSYENLYFPDYQSIIDAKLYEELFGQEDLPLTQASLNYKFNFILGSITLGVQFGQATLVDDRIGTERTIIVQKQAGSINFLLDNLMREPYVVPYLGVNFFQFNVTEKDITMLEDKTHNSGIGNSYTVGLLVNLNWIEPETAKESYLNYGLENTYLDIFWTKYENTNSDEDPNFTSDLNWGAGLRVEF